MSKEFKVSTDLHITRFADTEGKWIIEGIATTADLDVDGLYISEEALIGAEGDLRKYTTLLYNHDRDKEIGKILEVKYQPEQRALWIKALISKTVPDIWQKVNEEVLNKFSVSGTALDFTEKFVKGLDKAVKYVTQMRLFETSLVTVPADASARTMAFYVEKSMKTNKESKMAVKKKAKIVKNQDTEKVEKTEEVVERDAKAIDLMVDAVEDALRSEEKEVQVNTLRSVLDFLKAEQAVDGSDTVAKTLTLDDIVKAVDGVFEARFTDIKETVVALASTAKETVEKSAEKTDEETIEKGKEEDKEVEKIEKSADKVEKTEVEASTEDSRVDKLERSIEALTETIKTNMPIRKGLGAEDYKEDVRGEKTEDGDITKSVGYAKLSPLDKLKALHEQAEKVANAE